MDDDKLLATRFEDHRGRLHAVALRMLGSSSAAEDAVQDTWLRVARADTSVVENFGGWLTTIVVRVCLNTLRARNARQEELIGHLPDPVITAEHQHEPEDTAIVADSVGAALLVVLDTLPPAERLAFVLHDVFRVPFDEIAPMVGRSVDATRQLASRARRRVAGAPVPPRSSDRRRERETVNAFMLAAHRGDVAALAEVLDPDVVLRSDWGTRPGDAPVVIRGAEAVMRVPNVFGHDGTSTVAVRVNEEPGILVLLHGAPFALMWFSVIGCRIIAIDAIAQTKRVRQLEAALVGRGPAAHGASPAAGSEPEHPRDSGRHLDL